MITLHVHEHWSSFVGMLLKSKLSKRRTIFENKHDMAKQDQFFVFFFLS